MQDGRGFGLRQGTLPEAWGSRLASRRTRGRIQVVLLIKPTALERLRAQRDKDKEGGGMMGALDRAGALMAEGHEHEVVAQQLQPIENDEDDVTITITMAPQAHSSPDEVDDRDA
ncbi:hypothetical protein B0H13DRAFT_1853294 [Mycena leptocephala]|nr:hypothetical protein B0H13DRAFT_1853294 [Mycena leptocephala]